MKHGTAKLLMRAQLHILQNMPGMPKDPALEKELMEKIARPPGRPEAETRRRINVMVSTLDAGERR